MFHTAIQYVCHCTWKFRCVRINIKEHTNKCRYIWNSLKIYLVKQSLVRIHAFVVLVTLAYTEHEQCKYTKDFFSAGWPSVTNLHDDVIKWKHFPRYWPFVRGIHRSPVNSPHKGQWRGALMFSLICVWINGWINTREAGDLRRYRGHYDVIIMSWNKISPNAVCP